MLLSPVVLTCLNLLRSKVVQSLTNPNDRSMGTCWSLPRSTPLLEVSDGDENELNRRFRKGSELGEGEFGVVELLYDKTSQCEFACKTVLKSRILRRNGGRSPMSSTLLRREIEILQLLSGEHFCINAVCVYESAKAVMIVMENCRGGEMMQYVSNLPEDIRTELLQNSYL